jgi:hypothetical protein
MRDADQGRDSSRTFGHCRAARAFSTGAKNTTRLGAGGFPPRAEICQRSGGSLPSLKPGEILGAGALGERQSNFARPSEIDGQCRARLPLVGGSFGGVAGREWPGRLSRAPPRSPSPTFVRTASTRGTPATAGTLGKLFVDHVAVDGACSFAPNCCEFGPAYPLTLAAETRAPRTTPKVVMGILTMDIYGGRPVAPPQVNGCALNGAALPRPPPHTWAGPFHCAGRT